MLFEGRQLALNYAAASGGELRVELQDEGGQPIPGFALADCLPLGDDAIDQVVSWKSGSDVSSLAGKPVRLRFALRNADLYSLKFGP